MIHRARFSAGFTIIEVLMVLVILGILVAVGMPSMRDLISSAKVKGAASDAFSSLIFARSEAVKRNFSVDIVPVNAANWAAGWNVRVAGETANLSTQDPITGDITVTGPAATIRYRGDGRLIDPATGTLLAAEVAFTFVSSYSHIAMRCIQIDPSGRPSVRTDKDRNTANGCN